MPTASPPSNRTCGFPASGFPVVSRSFLPLDGTIRPSLCLEQEHLFRSGMFLHSIGTPVFSLSVTTARPLRSTGITPLPRYYGPLRLPSGPPAGFQFLKAPVIKHPPRWASQVPRPTFPHAPSSIAPGASVGAHTRCFPTDGRLPPSCRLGHNPICLTRPKQVRFTTAHAFVVRGFGARITPSHRPIDYMANGLLPWQLPFKLQGRPGFAWRTRMNGMEEEKPQMNTNGHQWDGIVSIEGMMDRMLVGTREDI